MQAVTSSAAETWVRNEHCSGSPVCESAQASAVLIPGWAQSSPSAGLRNSQRERRGAERVSEREQSWRVIVGGMQEPPRQPLVG